MAKVQEEKKQKNTATVSPKDLGIKVGAPSVTVSIAFALWIKSLLQNWRQGTVSCKGRSEVSRSGKKPWKQKGTGRARAGTARSPLWRGGGVTFGPQSRTRQLKVSKNVKRQILTAFLYDFLKQGKILSLDWSYEGEQPKTSAVYDLLKSNNLLDKKVLIFLSRDDLRSYSSLRNLPYVRLVFFDQANAFDLAKSDYWVFFKKDFDQFKEMVIRWTMAAS